MLFWGMGYSIFNCVMLSRLYVKLTFFVIWKLIMIKKGIYECQVINVWTMLDCSVINLFKLRTAFPGIPSPVYDFKLEFPKGGGDNKEVSITLKVFQLDEVTYRSEVL